MRRRQTLKVLGAAGVTASVSGCSGMLGSCGPGEDEIAAVAGQFDATPGTATSRGVAAEDRGTVRITGEIQAVGDGDVVVDDGTGTAKLTNLFSPSTAETAEEGDCVQASGTPYAPEDGSDYDVRLLVEELGPADS